MKEAIQIIKKPWGGTVTEVVEKDKDGVDNEGFVTFKGQYFETKNAKLYTPPQTRIPLYLAAVGERAVEAAALYTDGLITISKPDNCKHLFEIFDKLLLMNGKDPTNQFEGSCCVRRTGTRPLTGDQIHAAQDSIAGHGIGDLRANGDKNGDHNFGTGGPNFRP